LLHLNLFLDLLFSLRLVDRFLNGWLCFFFGCSGGLSFNLDAEPIHASPLLDLLEFFGLLGLVLFVLSLFGLFGVIFLELLLVV